MSRSPLNTGNMVCPPLEMDCCGFKSTLGPGALPSVPAALPGFLAGPHPPVFQLQDLVLGFPRPDF